MSEKLTNLTEATSTGSGDKFYVVQDGVSKQVDYDTVIPNSELSQLIEGNSITYLDAENNVNLINNLIIEKASEGGGTVNIPNGTFIVSKAINLLKNVNLKGGGKDVTTLIMHKDVTCAGANLDENLVTVQYDITSAERASVQISDMTLDFNIDNILATGIYKTEWQARIDTSALDNIGNCIQARGDMTNDNYIDTININNCILTRAAYHGTAIYMNSKNIRFYNNDMYDNYFRGVHIHGDNTFTAEDIYATQQAVFALA